MLLRNLLRWSHLARNEDGRSLLQIELEPLGNRIARGQLMLTIHQNKLGIAAGRPIFVLRIEENRRDRRLLLRIGLDRRAKHDVILTLSFPEESFSERKLVSNIDARDLRTCVRCSREVEVGVLQK